MNDKGKSSSSSGEVGGLRADVGKLWALMSRRRRGQFFLTLCLMLIGAVAEIISIGAVLPFLAIAADSAYAQKLPLAYSILSRISSVTGGGMITAAALLLIGAAIFAALSRLALAWVANKFVYSVEYDLTLQAYARVIRQRYDHYVGINSSAILSGFDKIYIVGISIIGPLTLAFTSLFIALCIIIFLFVVDPTTALLATVSMGLLYLLLSFSTKGLMLKISKREALHRTLRTKLLQESLGGMREIILDHSHGAFERRLAGYQSEARRLRTLSPFIQGAPRFIVESAGISLIALLAIQFSRQPGGISAAIPVLGAFALGAQRLLPLLQQVYLGWASYSIHSQHLADVIKLLELPIRASRTGRPADDTHFEQIELRGVSFDYADRAGVRALMDVDMVIKRGERVGIIGETGSGKSTLVDVLMGLLHPTSGQLLVDGIAVDQRTVADWQAQIAHVPQAIFLTDDSIAANIAFGNIGEPDIERIWEAADRANLRGFIEQLPDGIWTEVGERGVRMSGGQRQRLGIARALYKNATLLVLDEATSALDHSTEAAIMESVGTLDRNLTIIVIAHRLSTVAECDMIYRLAGGRIVQAGSFEQVVVQDSATN